MKSLSVALLLVCSCVLPAAPEELADVEQALGCPEWMCHSNSPLVDNYGFHDLNIRGVPNSTGFSLGTAVDANGTPIRISVGGGQLRGRYANGTWIAGSALAGSKIDINQRTGGAYQLLIQFVSESPLWAQGQQQWVPTYLIKWSILGTNRWTNLCPKPDKDLGMNAYYSVLFEGDRVDAKSKTIEPAADTDWFNIGCAGSTLAKMYLTGHTYASKAHGFATTVEQRQTMLKMLSADYCGGGKPFTVAGVPLDWADENGWMRYASATSTLEARWTDRGAACLNVPRVEASQHPAGLAEFPDLARAIEAECDSRGVTLSPCDQPDDDFLGYHLLSANP